MLHYPQIRVQLCGWSNEKGKLNAQVSFTNALWSELKNASNDPSTQRWLSFAFSVGDRKTTCFASRTRITCTALFATRDAHRIALHKVRKAALFIGDAMVSHCLPVHWNTFCATEAKDASLVRKGANEAFPMLSDMLGDRLVFPKLTRQTGVGKGLLNCSPSSLRWNFIGFDSKHTEAACCSACHI